jgi:hypothetical protein
MEYVEQKNRWPPPFSGSLKAGFRVQCPLSTKHPAQNTK